jgi:hypothetical protein
VLLLPTSNHDGHLDVLEPESPEALIREARQRTFRRRARLASVLVVLAGVVGVSVLLATGGSGVIAGTADSPYGNVRAFAGHGELAFVSRGQLWVLDGTGGALRHLRVPANYQAKSPTFSRDGRWLAFAVEPTNPNYEGTHQLWLAHANGTGAHEVRGIQLDELVGWNPHRDLLAVTAGRQQKFVPYGSPTAVQLVSPEGGVRTLVDEASVRPRSRRDFDAVDGAAWSPSGTQLAVVLQAGGLGSEIESVPIDGSAPPTVWFAAGNGPVHISGMRGRVPAEVIPQLAGWWSRWGIAFWVIDFGGVDNRDNTALAVIRSPGAQPRYVAQTLSLGITDAIAPTRNGMLALVASSTLGREFAAGKTVETCSPTTGRCRPVPAATSWSGPQDQSGYETCRNCQPARPKKGEPGSGVSQDPAWSPNGSLLVYEKAPVLESSAWPNNAWFADHAVYVWNSRAGTTTRVGSLTGSALPTWSGNGQDLLYESGDGLWLMPVATGRPIEVVHPLYSLSAWNNKVSHLGWISYYGQIPWHDQFSWWSPAR